MSKIMSDLFASLSSASSLRGLILAGTAFVAAKSLATAASARGYRRKLPVKKATASSSSEDNLLKKIKLDEAEFIALLGSFIAHTEKLQNNPAGGLVPQEDLIADLLLAFLEPYKSELEIRRVCYVEGRSNVIVKYMGGSKSEKVISFVGAHMDVVTANPAEFQRPPFQLTVEGDKLYGRGVTDCLGHVAMLACIFKQLAILKPKLKVGVAAVFIANEESAAVAGIGVDQLMIKGELEFARHAPLIWIDSANVGPTVGTAGAMTWEMKCTGYSGHSGVPQNAINGLSLGMEAIKYIQQRFYQDYPYSADAAKWNFNVGSSLKPTRVSMPEGGVTTIPREVTILGDVRFLPFYTPAEMRTAIEGYVAELNDKVIRNHGLPHSGGVDRFVIADPTAKAAAKDGETVPMLQGHLDWKWGPVTFSGVACDMNSFGYKALCDSIYEVTGDCKPFALTGSLPCIAELQAEGYDVQITGFGAFEAYHAANEFARLSGFEQGTRIIAHLIDHLNTHLVA